MKAALRSPGEWGVTHLHESCVLGSGPGDGVHRGIPCRLCLRLGSLAFPLSGQRVIPRLISVLVIPG